MARPPIPPSIRAVVWSRAKGCCAECKSKVLAGQGAVDHRPPLVMRGRVPGLSDTNPAAYIPHANDPDYLALVHDKRSGHKCHDNRTFGDDDKGGLRRGDLTENARSREITEKQAEFRAKMLAKAGVEPAMEPDRNCVSDVEIAANKPAKKAAKRWGSRPLSGPSFRGHRKMDGTPVYRKDKAR